MKKIILGIFPLIMLFAGCASSSQATSDSASSETEGLSLLEAIEQSAEKIATELPAESRVAILSFDTDSPYLSVFIMEELAGALFDRGIEIADRQNLDIIYRELTFQTSGEVKDSTIQSIGKFLGAEMVITGQMRPLGATYRFTANAIHVEKAIRTSIPRLTVRNDRELQNMITALNQQKGAAGAAATAQSERAIAEARVEEVRAAAEKITAVSSTAPEAQAVAALAAEALAAAEARAAEARAAEARAAEEARRTAMAAAVARIPVPTGLSAEAGYTTINLSWNAVSGAASYNIYRSAAATGTYSKISSRNSTNYTDNGLNQNNTYFYKISAVIDDLEGRQSAEVNARTISLTAGTMVPGSSLTEKLAWLQRSADSHNTYILEVSADENIVPQTLEFKGAINITVVLRGDNENRTIRLRSNGTMFTVNSNVTFVLENNITLMGHNGNNNGTMVDVNGGTFKMNTGSTITGNIGGILFGGQNGGGGGVCIRNGIFEMNGGTISSNRVSWAGGGVFVGGGGNFIMNGGTISDNFSPCGGGVVVCGSSGTFSMVGGAIIGNTGTVGGGVHLDGGSRGATFNMRGGTIAGNIAYEAGGGVVTGLGTFTKTGGTITGYNSDPINGNVVKDEAGNILARKGHAIFVNENLRKETTAVPGQNLSNKDSGRWD